MKPSPAFSHDEVVHGKKSMMHKMWEIATISSLVCATSTPIKFVIQVRNSCSWVVSTDQFLEWKSEEQLEWSNEEDPMNAKMKHFTSQLESIL